MRTRDEEPGMRNEERGMRDKRRGESEGQGMRDEE
jgi:hypothetical protein